MQFSRTAFAKRSWNLISVKLTTKFNTKLRTRSPISGEMSEPNCCNVVRNLLSLLSCLAPHAGGSWFTPFPTAGGDVLPDGLRCDPFTWGDVELTDLVSVAWGMPTEAFVVTGDDDCRWAGWDVPSLGESGILGSWVSDPRSKQVLELDMLFSAGWGTKEAENVFLTHCGRTRESWEAGQATFCCCLACAAPSQQCVRSRVFVE